MQLNPYLNFDGNAEEAFRFYQSVFGGELYIQKMTAAPGFENLTESERNRCMHIALPLASSQALMASDILPSMGHSLQTGNNNYISISTDSREEADRLFDGLSRNGAVEMPMTDMFWGDYYGSFKDQFGVCWMISHKSQPK